MHINVSYIERYSFFNKIYVGLVPLNEKEIFIKQKEKKKSCLLLAQQLAFSYFDFFFLVIRPRIECLITNHGTRIM